MTQDVTYYLQRGRLLAESHHFDEALDILHSARLMAPTNPNVHLCLANVLLIKGNSTDAIAHAKLAVEFSGEAVGALLTLALIQRELGEVADAIPTIERAINSTPQLPELYDCLGLLHQDAGKHEQAIRCFNEAINRRGYFPLAQLHRGTSYLMQAQFEDGWTDYEKRFEAAPPRRSLPNIPRWRGTDLNDERLLVICEQGIGDQIMFASCIPDLTSRVQHCIIECAPKLTELFRRSFPQTTVLASTEASPIYPEENADFAIPIGSLPGIFRRRIDDFPHHSGYLTADSKRRRRWRTRLDELGSELKVGIAWRGGTPTTRATRRSIELAQLEPILTARNVQCVSLTHTVHESEVRGLQHRLGNVLHVWQEAIENYDETAALVSELDLVISVQTAVVHLAGALGKTTWVLVPSVPEWRYMQTGMEMPWYPSVRLIRQKNLGDWSTVINEIRDNLAKLAVSVRPHPSIP